MPHVNIWIRKKDWAAWESLEDKPTFLHEALQNVSIKTIAEQVEEQGFTYVGESGEGGLHHTVTVKDRFGTAAQLDVKNGKVVV